MRAIRDLVTVSTLAVAATLAMPAVAQTAPPAPATVEPSDSDPLGEIIVTAQRVEQNLQNVPVAVSAFSADQLAAARATSVRDIAALAPSFTATEVNPGEPNYSIRGIGTEGINSNAGGDASVVMFIDGVYIGRGGGSNLELYDLERVEILRGPQGTLFGKNVVGGAISLVSRKPQFGITTSGAELTYGNYDRYEGLARFNIEAGENFAISGSTKIVDRNGYSFNAPTNTRVDDDKTVGSRLSFRGRHGDFEALLTADFTRQRAQGQPRDNICDTTRAGGISCVGVDPNPRVTNAIDDGFLFRKVGGVTAALTFDFGNVDLTSVTAYRFADLHHRDSFFANPVRPPNQIESINENIESSDQFSQELRLAFSAVDGRLNGVVGAYYLSEDIQRDERLEQYFPAPAQTGVGSFPQDVLSKSYALFGQFGFELVRGLTLTAGARMTWEEKDVHLQGRLLRGPGLPPPLSVPFDIRANESWKAFTPRFAIDYKITDRILVYGSAARGFKSGGFQGTAGTGASAATPYDPEYAWNYELGVKSRFLDNRVQVNVAGFRTDYTDLQVSQLVPLCCVVIGNAANAKIEGLETELSIVPFDGFRIDGSYSHLRARFTSFATGATANFTGNTLPRAPRNHFALAGSYDKEIGDFRIFGRLGWSRSSKIFFEASNTPLEIQQAYSLLDARVAFGSADKSWELSVWGKNLDNELIQTHIVAFAPLGQRLVTYQPPRTYGATLAFNF